MEITILGCGSSSGVPVIGCDCSVCLSNSKKNKRTRTSCLVKVNDLDILIDSSPDLRVQALENNITNLDAVLYTHAHADHCFGIHELRSFNYLKKDKIEIYGEEKVINELEDKFGFCFTKAENNQRWYVPSLSSNIITPMEEFKIGEVKIMPVSLTHGKITSTGFIIGKMAYCTDVNFISEEVLQLLSKAELELFIIDCLSIKPLVISHAYLEQTLQWIQRVKPKRSLLIHMGHHMDYEEVSKLLPEGVEIAYDGMKVRV